MGRQRRSNTLQTFATLNVRPSLYCRLSTVAAGECISSAKEWMQQNLLGLWWLLHHKHWTLRWLPEQECCLATRVTHPLTCLEVEPVKRARPHWLVIPLAQAVGNLTAPLNPPFPLGLPHAAS
ncbi:hypothetical protein CSUI_002511 [Cystoisospora suis]|uniref:Uncharacterized protein n=1 Tax=Cystoisospora suis TaxID=483139 RepID=A0A2C6L912_9APIC|nr:hypothetical protein CSUI_002511 [Cystoisospora suis]